MNHTMHQRRGMLLLLVLSMLTLFLMMGVTLLVVATRARTASRAFLNATSGMDVSPGIPKMLLDEALLLVVRGSKDQSVTDNVITDNLLGDMYGSNDSKVPFRAEQHDAFDSANPFLTQFNDDASVRKAAFQGSQQDSKIEVDNDGDGEADGVWLPDPALNPEPKVLPEMVSSAGGTLSFKVSYLVRDLDGRINVNAHGGGVAGDVLGPAMIDASSLEAFAGNAWNILQNGGTPSHGGTGHEDLREPPTLGQDLGGRGGSAYTLRLDRKATPPAGSPLTTAQPFSVGELERVLRPFDRDWSTLPPRLSAILADPDHAARETVTTDSWDVPYSVGEAAPAAAAANPELKFDLLAHAGDKAAFANALFNYIAPDGGARPTLAPRNAATAQWCANVAEFRDPGSGATTIDVAGNSVTGVKPTEAGFAAGDWTGNLASSGDLVAIPKGSKSEIEAILAEDPQVTPLHSLIVAYPSILDAVHVPSRFQATFDPDKVREPGRVNVNTCSDDVWNLVSGLGAAARPNPPMKSLWDLFTNEIVFTKTAGVDPVIDAKDIRRVDRAVANRLASLATFRSNVFAIWITLEVTDSSTTAGDPTAYRLFAIVDRSIPVEYKRGENTNVHETIRLKRFLN
jgi:hypothetical protein